MENEFCEIDFTTATAWENFNARLEEIFYGWKLYQPTEDNPSSDEKSDSFACDLGYWSVNSERVDFDGKELDISYFRKTTPRTNNDSKDVGKSEIEVVSNEENVISRDAGELSRTDYLPIEINCLSRSSRKFANDDKLRKLIRLYDLTDFVLLTSENSNAITLETHVKLLMSSFCISAFNTRCYLPMFAQVFQDWQNCFVGVRVDEDGFRIDYQMIHLGKIPSRLNYFSGILDLFKSRISTALSPNAVWASVKLSYSVSKFTNFAWPRFKRPISVEDASEEPIQLQSFDLPFGAACEPVNEIRLHVTWPKVFENMVMDNENHSDFDPQNAIYWALQVFPKETQHLLSQHIQRFTQMCQSSAVMHDLIGDLLKRRHFNDLNVPTNLSISRIIPGVPGGASSSNAAELKRSKKFLPEETLVSMLYYLFPDADENNTYPYSSKFEDCKEDVSLKGMKTCGMDELSWRLSIVMCIIAHLYGGHATAQFWYEFTQELRFRWEKGLRILGVLKGVPNHKTSLINQKLQMLNCCIQKKMKRENIDATSEDSDPQAQPEKYESEDEEFFDCQTEDKETKEDNFKTARVSLWNQPEGRLRKFNNLKLIETGEFMYIPITQEMTPKTEDQLEDDAVVLMKLGSDSQGSKLRARMMCASLYSDMESFKAANPGAVLEDFIRWYSPRDWIEDDDGELDKFGQRKGKLSNRMLLPGNMWREVWDTSIPVPACRQKCLFDDTKESEKVLHFFESYKHLGDIFCLLLPTLVHASLYTIINNETVNILRRYSPALDEKINTLIQKAVGATRNISVDVSHFKAVVDDISEVETLVTRYKSVEFKLFPGDLSHNEEERNMLIELVLGKGEITVPKGPSSRLGRRITYLFSKESEDAVQVVGENSEKKKDDNASLVSATNEFFHSAATSFNTTISHHQLDQWNSRTCPPYQKEFVLNVAAPLPHSSSRSSMHGLTAHTCSEEIFIASYFGRDLLFV